MIQSIDKGKPDLSHLNPHIVVYNVPCDKKSKRPAQTYKVYVSYSDHCYTASSKNGRDRVFDENRYMLSKNLPSIISDLLNRKCSFANGKNYFTIESPLCGGDYEIYFEVFKQPGTGSLSLFVHSAYVRDVEKIGSRPRWNSISFSVILFNTLKNRPLKCAKK